MTDFELAIDPRQVLFHRAGRDIELLRDLAVGPALRGEFRDPVLGLAQKPSVPLRPKRSISVRFSIGGGEMTCSRTDLLVHTIGSAGQRTGFAGPPPRAADSVQIVQGGNELESVTTVLQRLDRFPQQHRAFLRSQGPSQ